jgi:hypothetical protein
LSPIRSAMMVRKRPERPCPGLAWPSNPLLDQAAAELCINQALTLQRQWYAGRGEINSDPIFSMLHHSSWPDVFRPSTSFAASKTWMAGTKPGHDTWRG